MHYKKEDRLTDQFLLKWREQPFAKREERIKELMLAFKIGNPTKKQRLEAEVLGQIAKAKGEIANLQAIPDGKL